MYYGDLDDFDEDYGEDVDCIGSDFGDWNNDGWSSENESIYYRTAIFKQNCPAFRHSLSIGEQSGVENENETGISSAAQAHLTKARQLVMDNGPFLFFPDDQALIPDSILYFYYQLSLDCHESYCSPLIDFLPVEYYHEEWRAAQAEKKVKADEKKRRGNKRNKGNNRNPNRVMPEKNTRLNEVDRLDPVTMLGQLSMVGTTDVNHFRSFSSTHTNVPNQDTKMVDISTPTEVNLGTFQHEST